MPITKNVFIKGKMNKDLDERIVPNGEYRDALNVQISTSDGSDIGVMQNVLGNKLAYDSAINITGGKCIGSVADTENNKIYWFIAGNDIDAIAEYDEVTKSVSPVLVSVKEIFNALNFNKSKLTTGVNIIDGLLLFTDDNSEPKKINIEDCKKGSENFSTHTKFIKYDDTEYNFEENHISVIKKYPLTAPIVNTSNTARIDSDGNPALVFATGSRDFSDSTRLEKPGKRFVEIFPTRPDFRVGDKISLKLVNPAEGEENAEIICTCYKVPQKGSSYSFIIESISENIPPTSVEYEYQLIEEEPLFEKDFVRFAYRYKYKDGEYSAISPFSNVVFLPGNFEYDPAKGYNLGMSNTIRYLKILNFANSNDLPNDISKIELLFKKDTSTNIYSVKEFTYNDVEWSNNSYEIKSELIHNVLPSNQLLRPYDNVPKKAKAQEIVANRLIYGNYLQNFDLKNKNNLDYSTKFTTRLNLSKNTPVGNITVGKSIKSMRSYQLGVTFIDEYGRETPIQTDDSGTLKVNKDLADKYTGIHANLINEPPSFAKSFKFYIKETSNQYYNLSMDRWYDAEDGNVWISFPSSERNKVDEETFLILKKKHNSDNLVTDIAKYKIVDIKNEAPDEIKEIKISYGELLSETGTTNIFHATDFPKPETTFFKIIDGDDEYGFEDGYGKNSNLLLDSNRFVKIKAPGIGSSKLYEVRSISKDSENDYYIVNLSERLENDVAAFFPNDLNTGRGGGVEQVGVEFFKSEIKNKKEYVGRFFAKIHRDRVLDDNVLNILETEEYSIITTKNIYNRFHRGNDLGDYRKDEDDRKIRFYVDHHRPRGKWRTSRQGTKVSLMPKGNTYRGWWFEEPIKPGRSKICLQFLSKRDISGIKTKDNNSHTQFITSMTTIGTRFRFTQDPNKTVYKITDWAARGCQKKDTYYGDDWSENKHTIMVFQLNKSVQGFEISNNEDTDVAKGNYFDIEILEVFESAKQFKSDNPAIWETEPKESVDIDLYYEASDAIESSLYNNDHSLNWFNCFSFGNGVESNRIRDDFNAPVIAKGVKVSAPLAEQYKEERRKNGLIFSGIFNSTSGINRLNQFIAAENITKDLNPEYGSIQKLHTRDTDLITFCEDKVLKVLAQKDALFNADGNANVTSNAAVLGQAIPFVGEFGISKNPESFASYGYRMYFADKSRGMVMRLSRNGLESISAKGMQSYFYDKLSFSNRVIGTFDVRKGNYNLTLIKENTAGDTLESLDTISYKEEAQGWPSRKSYIPESGLSLNNLYYTFKNGELYSHDNEIRNTFYGNSAQKSSVKLILNSNPSEIKNYKTVNYEGDTGWTCSSIITDQQNGNVATFIEEEGKYYNFIKGIENTWDNTTQSGGLDTKEFSTQGIDTLQSITDATGQTEVTITIKENND